MKRFKRKRKGRIESRKKVLKGVKGVGKSTGKVAKGVGKSTGDVAKGVGKSTGDVAKGVGKSTGEVAKEFKNDFVKSAKKDFKYVKQLTNEGDVVLCSTKRSVGGGLRNLKEKGFVLETVKRGGKSLGYNMKKNLKKDKNALLQAVKRDGYALRHTSVELQNDKEVVLEAVKQKGKALQFASDELRNDKEVVLEAVKRDGESICFAGQDMQNDKDVVLEAAKGYGKALKYASKERKNDKGVVLKAVREFGSAIKYISHRLKNDKDVILESVKLDGLSLEYANKRLKNDREVALEAVKKDNKALRFVSKEIVKKARKSGMRVEEWLINEKQNDMEEDKRQALEEKDLEWEEEFSKMEEEHQRNMDRILGRMVSKHRISPKHITINREAELGEGKFGKVYPGEYTGRHGKKVEVAVKVVRCVNKETSKEVLEEFMSSIQFEHKNVIDTIGFDDSKVGEIAFVMEKMEGNLHDYVCENVLTLGSKAKIMEQMTNGIHYLHTQAKFIHRDIKGENFLYTFDKDGEVVVKVCDFGLAKQVKDSNRMETEVDTAGQGTKLWFRQNLSNQANS